MKIVDGKPQPLNAADVQQAAIDDARHVDQYRAHRADSFRAEAFQRIAALYGKTDWQSVILSEMNDLARAVVLLKKVGEGTATSVEIAELDALQSNKAQIDAIRAAENAATAALRSAGTNTAMALDQRIAEIDAVTPTWP